MKAYMAPLLPNYDPPITPKSVDKFFVVKAGNLCHKVISRSSASGGK
jgi:hypothetical protein